MPYNFVADSFHTKKLCSRLSSSEVRFLRKSAVLRLFIYYEIVHEYTIKKKKSKSETKQYTKNQSCNHCPGGWKKDESSNCWYFTHSNSLIILIMYIQSSDMLLLATKKP